MLARRRRTEGTSMQSERARHRMNGPEVPGPEKRRPFGGRRMRATMGTVGALALTLTAATSTATPPQSEGVPPDRAACVSAHQEAQALRNAGKLLEAGKK